MTNAPKAPTPAIELRAAERSYGSGAQAVHALRPVDLRVHHGDYLAIMGRSGSGKSTLLNVLGLLVRPSAGTVLVDGRDTADLGDEELSAIRGSSIGFVFQSFHLLPALTALENVELPLVYGRVPPAQRHSAAAAAIERVGVARRAHALPRELSGGERQRVAVARAVVRRPPLLLCDEPTGNLDSESATQLMALLGELNGEGIAVALVTHDPEIAAHAGQLLRLVDGAPAEPGEVAA